MVFHGPESPAVQNERLVLVVDDDPVARKLLHAIADRCECRVHDAGSVEDARAQIANHVYCLIVLDAHLPDGHGEEVARAVRADPKAAETVIVAVSSDNSRKNTDRLFAAEVDLFRAKPFSAADMGRLMRRSCDQAGETFRGLVTPGLPTSH